MQPPMASITPSASFPRYGALSGRNTGELLVGARVAPGEDKRDPLDFALWKFAKPGEPAWPSPWGEGRGRVGISSVRRCRTRCSGSPSTFTAAATISSFRTTRTKSHKPKPLFGPPMAEVWMHGGLLQFDGKKMSKSLGNFEPLGTLLDRHDPQAIRMLFLQAGYRKPLNFTEASVDGATTGLRRLQASYDVLRTAPANAPDETATIPPSRIVSATLLRRARRRPQYVGCRIGTLRLGCRGRGARARRCGERGGGIHARSAHAARDFSRRTDASARGRSSRRR